MPTPSQQDPTRTITLRSNFRRGMRTRFATVRKAIRELVVKNDAFGLEPAPAGPGEFTGTFNVQPNGWRFLTNPQKVDEFRSWLQDQVDSNILQTTTTGKPWTNTYIDSAYRKGMVRSYIDTRKLNPTGLSPELAAGQEAFMNSAFAAPDTLSKLELLYTRAFESLRGVTATMASDMSRVLADGLGRGDNPLTIARAMTSRVDTLTRTRAEVIARTEIIHAHAEGQLDSFERLGVEDVGGMAEWSTAGDDRVCSRCAALEGAVMKIEEARGMIPLHPNCRCAWIPVIDTPTKKATPAMRRNLKS